MKNLPFLAGLVVVLPLAAGCAGRTAPFDQMDRAQITVLRLQQPAPSPVPAQGLGIPGLPGVPPELQTMGQAVVQGLGNVVPGLANALPGLVPGMQPQGQQPQLPQFKGYSIVAQQPVADDRLKDELLDVLGHENSFSNQVQPCFAPGMGIVFQRPNAPEVDVLVSLSCNQVKMDGAPWPYAVNGLTPDARGHLGRTYEKLFGPVPPGA